ncbi:ribosomal protein L7/L12 [Actinomadura sp. GTD37]|uniref:ribosomal protein L7/L12 n=1 Tax=Actinomadura sp. GTD37 TaxID=1778030 RepID=UPI0035BF189A
MKWSASVRHIRPEDRERVVEMVAEERYIPAVKLVREVTGLGLKEAKEYVDALKGEALAARVPPEVRERALGLIAAGGTRPAAKMVRAEAGLGSRAAKDYVDALRDGRVARPVAGGGTLSDRVRAFKDAGDHASALALVCAETGMSREEAARFVDALR